jgi:uncharacterized OB-fold protein
MMEGTMVCDTVWDEPPETVVFKGKHDWPYYVPERTATHMIVNHGVTGHSACTGCGKAIDPWDEYCRHCGARLEGGWK